MIIKSPVVIDISHWEPVADYAAISPRPAMLIAKATEGYMYRDEWFLRHMAGASKIGALRGMYHFHRKDISAAAQVKNFCDTVRQIITKRDVIVLDVEEGGETAAQLMAWYEGVMAQYPDNPYWIYSRKNLLDPIAMVLGIFSQTAMEQRIERNNPLNAIQMTLAERTFFRTKLQATWTAGYPANPDLYNSVPSFYIPDQTKYPPVKVWQYTDKGQVAGIDGDVDLNWIDSQYFASLGGTVEPPNQDVVTEPFQGVKSITGLRYGWKFWIDIFDPAKTQIEVTHAKTTDKRDTVSATAKAKNAQIAYNGGEWDRALSPAYPLDYSVSNGAVYQPDSGLARPSLIISKTDTPKIVHEGKSGAWQAVSGARYILINGQPPAYLDGTAPQYTEGHNRTCYGVTADGKVMAMTSNGAYPNQGLTLKQAAVLMQSYGAVVAFDGGGGGDTTRVINGIVTNNPQDGAERRVPEFVLVYAKENDAMADYYEYTATGNRAIRTGAAVTYPRIVQYSDLLYNTKAKGGALPSDRVTLATDLYSGSVKVGMAGDVWVRVYDNNGKTVDGWTALKHMGVMQLTEKLVTVTTPPPIVEPFSVTVTVTADGYYDGTTTITMTPK